MLRLALWFALVGMVPVPYALVDLGWVPVVRLLAMGGLTGWIWITEGGLVSGLVAGIILLQALLHAGWQAWVAGALLRRIAATRRTVVVLAITVVLFLVAQWPIYRTPLSNQALRANFWGIFQ